MMDQELVKLQSLVQDLATQSRIAEYTCACAVLNEDWERAKLEAKRADIFRQSFIKTTERYLNELEEALQVYYRNLEFEKPLGFFLDQSKSNLTKK